MSIHVALHTEERKSVGFDCLIILACNLTFATGFALLSYSRVFFWTILTSLGLVLHCAQAEPWVRPEEGDFQGTIAGSVGVNSLNLM